MASGVVGAVENSIDIVLEDSARGRANAGILPEADSQFQVECSNDDLSIEFADLVQMNIKRSRGFNSGPRTARINEKGLLKKNKEKYFRKEIVEVR